MQGHISSLKRDNGYGFIKGEDGVSRFFHANGVVPSLKFKELEEGLKVEFEP